MNQTTSNNIYLSIIIPVSGRHDPVTALYEQYKKSIEATGLNHEIIYVLDGGQADVADELNKLKETEDIKVIILARRFGEATALNAAFSESSGEVILTLPAYQQIENDSIPELVSALEGNDMVLARRWPRKDSLFNRLQAKLFNGILRSFTDLVINDAGCSVRVFRRRILDEVQVYGDMYRFFPIMANRQGFRIIEVDTPQSQSDAFQRIYSPGIYIRRMLDMLTVLFLAKFIKKPLRFFGLVGTGLLTAGFLTTMYLILDRLIFDTPLADRPALFLSSLLIVLGIQVIAIGLIGEIVVFTHAKDLKEYKVEKIIN